MTDPLDLPPRGFSRIEKLPDGRTVEFLDGVWDPDDSDPPGSIGVKITVAVDGEVTSRRLVWSSEHIEAICAAIEHRGRSDA